MGELHEFLNVAAPRRGVRGLLALIVRELHTVPMDAVGGGSGAGHGRITAASAVLTRRGPGADAVPVDLVAAVDDPESADRAAARSWLAALHDALATSASRPRRGDAGP